jgi:hypothetical protein
LRYSDCITVNILLNSKHILNIVINEQYNHTIISNFLRPETTQTEKKRDERKFSHGSGQTSISDSGYSRTFTLTYVSTLKGLYGMTKTVKINEHVHDYNRVFKYTVSHIDELIILII